MNILLLDVFSGILSQEKEENNSRKLIKILWKAGGVVGLIFLSIEIITKQYVACTNNQN